MDEAISWWFAQYRSCIFTAYRHCQLFSLSVFCVSPSHLSTFHLKPSTLNLFFPHCEAVQRMKQSRDDLLSIALVCSLLTANFFIWRHSLEQTLWRPILYLIEGCLNIVKIINEGRSPDIFVVNYLWKKIEGRSPDIYMSKELSIIYYKSSFKKILFRSQSLSVLMTFLFRNPSHR